MRIGSGNEQSYQIILYIVPTKMLNTKGMLAKKSGAAL